MYNTGINDEHRPLMTFDSQEETWKIQKPLGMGLLALVLGAILLVGLMGFSAGVHMEKTFSKSASDDPDAQITQQTEFSKDPRIQWLLHNHLPSGLPLAYQVDPPDYFETLPTELRPKGHTEHKDKVGVPGPPECGGQPATLEQWDKYDLQTEKMLVSTGCVIYDAAVGSIALAVGGYHDAAAAFFWQVLEPGHTAGIMNIRGTAPCKGREAFGECTDKTGTGACGLCYGDATNYSDMTAPYRHAMFFRLIGDYWNYEGTKHELCPDLGRNWVWVDWKPVLGDNSWAQLLGTTQVLWLRKGGNPKRITPFAPELKLAIDFIGAVKLLRAGDTGGMYFCPRNTYYGTVHADIGSQVSTENSASTLAGLKALRYLLIKMNRPKRYATVIQDLNQLIEGILKFLKAAYLPSHSHFRTGGAYDPRKGTFKWEDEVFAVDCQSWVGSVLGADQIDGWFGKGTTLKLWDKTKEYAGYGKQPNGWVKGVGYSQNDKDQVMSGEWTYGAANFLKIVASDSSYSSDVKKKLMAEAEFMVKSIKEEITATHMIGNIKTQATLYANKRYLIPPELGGWWANPLPSRASTSWGVLWDADYNPLHLLGKFTAKYDT
jgi:hypothetical protein|uniref:Uncharacterized protein n=1 Tax=Eutreptiella gymnastica TaxID=73025 RepID=A0A7S4FS70_9EUGL|eukprot:CAMPEP_0174282504 /NCGR_PEP_ID=MMETSP0809-20121228/3016_1 /TAXON_ID=73025 ORGANISM="Eutreptiella gymnastica-like, Strain CCMP1594" /NCGR_SAMPLE_ID=MMETSP0809 /ASSEMBLY_ACC=CAM_ASM_000658 /LENGTH=602 /DNA_ID=CAMNT_0015376763 /DNA_START=42 /DNA_END=1850 /DNA_ORIENTATION=+